MNTATRRLTTRARRLLATMALVAQWVAVAAPLVDIHPAASAVTGTAALVDADSRLPGGERHDASQCPGCIAQSIHAAPAPTARMIALTIGMHHPPEATAAGRPIPGDRSPHRSRAPPSHS